MWYKNLLLIAIVIFGNLCAIQAQTKQINNINYKKIDSVWYQLYIGKQYKVNESLVTVKFVAGLSDSQKTAVAQLHNCNIIRSNSIGYYDLGITGNYGAIYIVEDLLMDTLISFAEPNTIGEYCTHPNDTLYWSTQWHLQDEDDTGGIDAYIAWGKENGDSSVIISILDSGTEILHEDLEGNVWVNPGEDLDNDGVVWDMDDIDNSDNDGNGYIDDLVGWDFENNNNDVTNNSNHGTHVAGIVGAETNDNQGTAGVSGGWTNSDKECRMMIGALGALLPDSAVIDDAILYAAQNGAKIITLSLECGYNQSIADAIDTAYTYHGVFIVASSSNNSNDTVSFPAILENTFAVGASTELDVNNPIIRKENSNFGEDLMLVAPGINVGSTYKDNAYGTMDNTSVAAPQVAATAGLILSRYPDFNASDVAKAMCLTAMKIPGFDFAEIEGYPYGAWNEEVGYGKLNANRAIGILDDISTNRSLYEGNYITDSVHVLENSTLTLKKHSRFHLLKTGKLIVDKGATLIIEDSVEVYGNVYNKIVVNGQIEIGEEVTFQKSGSFLCAGLEFTDGSTVSDMDNVTFNGFKLENHCVELNITNSTFKNLTFTNSSILRSYTGDVNISNTNFNHTGLFIENQTINDSYTARIYNCTFFNDYPSYAVELWNYENFTIDNNTIEGCENGIFMSHSGVSLNSSISNNEIYNCTMAGVQIFNSTASLGSNYIHDNGYGIKLYNNGNITIYGNHNAQDYSQMNYITNNDSWELYASAGSFPWYFGFNAIIDEDNEGNQYDDPMVYAEPPGGSIMFNVQNNCWTEDNNFSPIEDLYPSNYLVSPTYCPPSGGHKSSELALKDFQDGLEQFENEEYTDAKSSFEYVIETYSKTQYASAAMKELLALEKFLESDYLSLQDYYESNDSIQADSTLAKLAIFLGNKCEIEMENWQTAIDHFEDVIENPDTPEDSIFAIIDLGYTYFLMENSDSRSTAQGRMLEHKPDNFEAFTEKRDYLLSLLPFKKSTEKPEVATDKQSRNKVFQNVPNPFTNSTTVYYNLTVTASVYFKIYDNMGKEVKLIDATTQTQGQHKVEIDMKGFPKGIYFYSMYINGQLTDSKKMIVK